MISLTIQADIPRLSLDDSCLDGLRKSAANEVLLTVKDNFARLGGRRYYMQAADSTEVTADATSATVTVSHVGVRLRWQGGTVLPGAGISSKTGQPTKLLAIPANKSVRKAPGAYGDLQYVPLPGAGKIKAMLVIPAKRKPAKAGKRKGPRKPPPKPAVAFWLADRTDHPANPKVMPTDDQLRQAALAGAQSYLSAHDIIRRNGGIAIPANIINPRQHTPRR